LIKGCLSWLNGAKATWICSRFALDKQSHNLVLVEAAVDALDAVDETALQVSGFTSDS
jgi:hypothetical protein